MNATATPATYVDPYPGRKGSERVDLGCGHCGGTGLYGGRTGYHDRTGRPYCFDCGGTGSYTVLVSSARATARREAKRAEESARKVVTAKAAYEANVAATDPAVVAWISANVERSAFAESLSGALSRNGLTENQTAAVLRTIAKDAEQAESRRELAEGRRVLTGTVVTVKETESAYGTAWKILVELEGEGARVYGSLPSSIADAAYAETWDGVRAGTVDHWTDAVKGRRITFTAKVERSAKDASFGFFSRPTKAAMA